MNHLETHIRTCAPYLGVERTCLVAIDYQEFDDQRHKRSVEDAYAAVAPLVERLQGALTGTDALAPIRPAGLDTRSSKSLTSGA